MKEIANFDDTDEDVQSAQDAIKYEMGGQLFSVFLNEGTPERVISWLINDYGFEKGECEAAVDYYVTQAESEKSLHESVKNTVKRLRESEGEDELSESQKEMVQDMVQMDFECRHPMDYEQALEGMKDADDLHDVAEAAANYYEELVQMGPVGIQDVIQVGWSDDYMANYGGEMMESKKNKKPRFFEVCRAIHNMKFAESENTGAAFKPLYSMMLGGFDGLENPEIGDLSDALHSKVGGIPVSQSLFILCNANLCYRIKRETEDKYEFNLSGSAAMAWDIEDVDPDEAILNFLFDCWDEECDEEWGEFDDPNPNNIVNAIENYDGGEVVYGVYIGNKHLEGDDFFEAVDNYNNQ